MIFKIDKSCLNVIENEYAIKALNTLAYNREKGRNFIFAEKEVLDILKEKDCLDSSAQKVFKSLFNNSSENKLYFESVNKYINIVEKIDGDRVVKVNDKEECKVKLEELSSNNMTDITIIITENRDDYELYKLIAKYYAKSKRIKTSIWFDLKLGGGSTTSKTLEYEIETNKEFETNKKLCLCIVDSDIKFLNGPAGDTKKSVEEFIKKKTQDFWKVIFLDVHEIENLLPICWMEKCTTDIKTSSETIKFLKYLTDKEKEHKAIYYFDIKNGIKKEKFICKDKKSVEKMKKFRKDEEYRKFCISYLKDYGIEIDKIKDEHIINGLSTKILSKVVKECIEKNWLDELNPIDEHLKEKWASVGKDVFSWGCVGNRIL